MATVITLSLRCCRNREVAYPRHNITSSHSAEMYDAHEYFSQHGQPLEYTQHGVNEFVMMSVVVLLDGEGEEEKKTQLHNKTIIDIIVIMVVEAKSKLSYLFRLLGIVGEEGPTILIITIILLSIID
eukprot:scaffold2579_cov170-Ochromonas_danica.AAC.1